MNSVMQRGVYSFFIRHNLFYKVSALLMLVGCYLVMAPYLLTIRELPGLLKLLGAINGYEAAVIACCLFILRHEPKDNNGPLLLLVQSLFLLDGTFTANACFSIAPDEGAWVLGCSLLLGLVKLAVLRRGPAGPALKGLMPMYVGGMAVTYGTQIVMSHVPVATAWEQGVCYLLWLGVGAFLLLAAILEMSPREESEPVFAWGPVFRKFVFALLATVVIGQLVAQTWLAELEWRPQFILPVFMGALCLLQALHPWFQVEDVSVVLFAILLFVLDAGHSSVNVFGMCVEAVNCAFAGLAIFSVWLRRRESYCLEMSFLFLILGAHQWSISGTEFLVAAAAAPALAFAALCAMMACRRTMASALVFCALFWVLTAELLSAIVPDVSANELRVSALPLLWLIVLHLYGDAGAPWRIAAVVACAVFGLAAGNHGGFVPLCYAWGILLVLAASQYVDKSWTRLVFMGYAATLCAIRTQAWVAFQPSSKTDWGVLAILTAFVALAFAAWFTRERVRGGIEE